MKAEERTPPARTAYEISSGRATRRLASRTARATALALRQMRCQISMVTVASSTRIRPQAPARRERHEIDGLSKPPQHETAASSGAAEYFHTTMSALRQSRRKPQHP